MEANQDLSIQDEEITVADENSVTNNNANDSTVVEEESADKSFEETVNEGGLANSEPENDGLEKESYINPDLISEEDIADARETVSAEPPTMPDSNLSDPTQSENN